MNYIRKIIAAVSGMIVGLLGVLTILHASIVVVFSGTPDNNLYAFLKLSGLFQLIIVFGGIFWMGFLLLLFCGERK